LKMILIKNLKKVNEKNCEEILKSIVVLANPRSILNYRYAKKEIKNQIIKHDQLISYMKNLHDSNKDDFWLSEEGMYRLANILMSYHKENELNGFENILDIEVLDANGREESKGNNRFRSIGKSDIYKELKEYRLKKSREEALKP